MGYIAATAFVVSTYMAWRGGENAKEAAERQNKIAKMKWKEEVARRKAEWISISGQLDQKQLQIGMQKRKAKMGAELDYTARASSLEVDLGEKDITGNLKARLENQIALTEAAELMEIESQADLAEMNTEQERTAAYARTRAPKYIDPNGNYDNSPYWHILANGIKFGADYYGATSGGTGSSGTYTREAESASPIARGR